jgi:Ca-activated chloride channel homolog
MKTRRILVIILILLLALLAMELLFRSGVLRNSLGRMLYQSGRYDSAAALFEQNGDDSVAKANLGKALYQEGHTEEAAKAFDEALAASEDKADLLYDRGNAAYASKDYQAAVENYTESLVLDPEDKDTKANLELALRKLLENPPPQPEQKPEEQEQDRNEEEVRNLLDAMDNKEAQDRKDQKPRAPHRSENWW